MNKPKIENVSDYAKLKEMLSTYSKYLLELEKEIKKLKRKELQLEIAENTLQQVQDLINSNEEIAFFHTAKKEFNRPIDLYFRGQKK